MPTKFLAGKNAIVTGSTSGIGEAIATALAEQGANIMLNGFGDAGVIETLRKKIADQHGVQVLYSGADVTKGDEIEKMVKDCAAQLGSVDILVNNAGIQFTAPIDQFPTEKWDAVIATNLSSSFHAIKHVLPIMRQKGWGRIVNTISTHGLVGSATKSAYVAAKHGMVGLTQVVALETAQENITCNGVCPGWVLTPLVQKQIEDRANSEGKTVEDVTHELVDEKQPTHKFVKAEDVAAFVVFLCGPNSGSITGAALTIDGGWTAE